MSTIRFLQVNTASSNSLSDLATPENTSIEFSLEGLTHEEKIIIASLSYTQSRRLELAYQQKLAEELSEILDKGTTELAADEWDAEAYKRRAREIAHIRKDLERKRALTMAYKTPTHENSAWVMKGVQKAVGVADGVRMRLSDINRIRKFQTGTPILSEKVSNGLGHFSFVTSVFDFFIDLVIPIIKAYKKKKNESKWSLIRFYNNMKKDGRPVRIFGSIISVMLGVLGYVAIGGSAAVALNFASPVVIVLIPVIAKIQDKLRYSALLNKIQKQIDEVIFNKEGKVAEINEINQKMHLIEDQMRNYNIANTSPDLNLVNEYNGCLARKKPLVNEVINYDHQLQSFGNIRAKTQVKKDALESQHNMNIVRNLFFAGCAFACMFSPAGVAIYIATAMMAVGIAFFIVRIVSLCKEYSAYNDLKTKRKEIEVEGESHRQLFSPANQLASRTSLSLVSEAQGENKRENERSFSSTAVAQQRFSRGSAEDVISPAASPLIAVEVDTPSPVPARAIPLVFAAAIPPAQAIEVGSNSPTFSCM